jgi:predicted acyltransferase
MLTGRGMQASSGPWRAALGLAAAGLAALGLGALWGAVFPINKNLWTSSFVLWTAGWSLLLLAAFHIAFDIWKWRRLALVLSVVGTNAITAYLLARFVDFEGLVARVVRTGTPALELVVACLGLAGLWGVLSFLHRRRWFLRV